MDTIKKKKKIDHRDLGHHKYSGILFVDPILKNDKNPDLTVKNSNLYKLELTITLPKRVSLQVKQ